MTAEACAAEAGPLQPLIRKLENHGDLSEQERQALRDAAGPLQSRGPREDVLREGQPSTAVAVLLSGFACCYKTLPDGRRQIIGYSVAGDLCNAGSLILKRMNYTVSTLTPSLVTLLNRDSVLDITSRHPQLARSIWWNSLAETTVSREWLVNIGQRTALERIAHFFCEIHARLQAVGSATPNGCELPLTQSDLADATALSAVHVNRTLKELRRAGLVSLNGRSLLIHDFPRLRSLAMFDPSYLHLNCRSKSASNL